jgi:hypothetical protein
MTTRRLMFCIGLAGIFGALLSGCGGGGSLSGNVSGGNNSTREACAVNPSRAGRPKWTVLIFMNAANDLQPDSLTNIGDMMRIGSDANLNIIVQWKQANCPGCGTPSFNETRRYRITRHTDFNINQVLAGNTAVLDGDRLPNPATPLYNQQTKQMDMGDSRVLQEFVRWGAANYPADNLAVVIWNHGAGWRPTRSSRQPQRFRAVSIDNDTNNEISTQQLPDALSGTAQPIDALIFDASLMQMGEVAYQVRNSARVMIGSEDSPPGRGYPYHLWLGELKNQTPDPCTLGTNIVTSFVNFYTQTRPDFTNITQSSLDLSRMTAVMQALENFGSALRRNIDNEAGTIRLSRQQAQRYNYIDHKDLWHYADLVERNALAPDLVQTARALKATLVGNNGVVMTNGRGIRNQDNSNGLAIYVPSPANYLPSYGALSISQPGAAPNWARFLQEQRD